MLQAWQKLAEIVPSIKRTAAGDLPLDAAFPNLPNEGAISFYLLPTKGSDQDDKPSKPWKGGGKGSGKKGDRGTKRDADGKEKVQPELPDALKDIPNLKRTTSKGKRLCWSYNIKDRLMGSRGLLPSFVPRPLN